MVIIWLVLGLALLVAGGEGLVRGAVGLARRLGLSPLLVGLTVVGFGTSTPELVTSLQAALAGSPGIALGNVVGSNIANALLILGLAALLRPFSVEPTGFRRDGPALGLATLVVIVALLAGGIGRPVGAVLLFGLAAYLGVAYRLERRSARESAELPTYASGNLAREVALCAGGIALTVVGARLLVGAAVDLARDLGVSETLIGLTLVAVGTSLPELVTSVVAAARRQGAVAFGNVVGSNIYNLLGILGITAMVRPVPVPPGLGLDDLVALVVATAALGAVAVTGWRVTRLEGAGLALAYAAYLGWLAVEASW